MSFSLRTNGQAFTGWIEVNVTRGLDQFAHSFELRCAGPHLIDRGALVEIAYAEQLLCTGYADAITNEIVSGSLAASVQGRSKTADLVDCAVVHKTGQWINRTAREVISDIVQPFGIPLVVDPTVQATKVRRFDLETGERAFDAIDRLARVLGFLPITTPDGGLKLIKLSTRAGLRSEKLPIDQCIRRGTEVVDSGRYSEYRLLSQTNRSSADDSPRRAALEKFSTLDKGVKRYRPEVVTNTTGARQSELQAHAEWARNTAFGRSERYNADVAGILSPSGRPWEPGMLLLVDDRDLRVNEILLVVNVVHQLNRQQLQTNMQCTRIEAYTTEPIPEKELQNRLRRI